MNDFLHLYELNADTAPMELSEEIYFYKFSDPHVGSWDNEPIERRYRAYRETPKGYWVVPDYDWHPSRVTITRKKWLRKQSRYDHTQRKLFAYQSKEDALYSYYRRKLEHLRHLQVKHNQLKGIIRRIENSENFFGAQRPQIRHIDDFMSRRHGIRELTPLKRERPTKEFIEDKEFAIL